MANPIERYLAALREQLRVSPALRERILCEIEDHLLEGAAREEERGEPPEEAQRRVIERFGAPDVVAIWWSEVYPDEKEGGKMWQRFTERARRVIFFAQEEAARLGENYVGTEHLLLGLIREDDSVAGRILQRMGLSSAQIRAEVEKQVTHGKGHQGKDMQLTPRAKRVIDLAYEEARQLNNNYIGTEHLLIGLVREGDGLGGRVLLLLGANLERTRHEVRMMQEGSTDLMQRAKGEFLQFASRTMKLPSELLALVKVLALNESGQLADTIASFLRLTPKDRLELLETKPPDERLKKVEALLKQGDTTLQMPPGAGTESGAPASGTSGPSAQDASPGEIPAWLRAPAAVPPPSLLSSPPVTEAAWEARKAETLASLAEGQTRRGVVRRLREYGAHVDLGGVEALLDREEMSWTWFEHPAEVLSVGDEIDVMVLKVDQEAGKMDREGGCIAVGLRQLQPDPWSGLPSVLQTGMIVVGSVRHVGPNGAYVTLQQGIGGWIASDGLTARRRGWLNEGVQVGDLVEVKILDIQPGERTMKLGRH